MVSPEKTVHFSFGPHTDFTKYPQEQLRNISVGSLEAQPDKAVVYLAEHVDEIGMLSDYVYTLSKKGYPPSLSEAMVLFFVKTGEITPGLTDEALDFYDVYQEGVKGFHAVELGFLDNLSRDYPNRVRILPEKQPSDFLNKESTLDYATRVKVAAADAVLNGFESALPNFKEAIMGFAGENTSREERILGQIDEVLEDETVSTVIVRLGASHSPIRYQADLNYKITSSFDTDSEGFYYYQPYVALVRAHRINPNLELSEFEWYKGLIASLVDTTLENYYQTELFNEYASILIPFAGKFVAKEVHDMDDVWRIDALIKSRGLGGFIDYLVSSS